MPRRDPPPAEPAPEPENGLAPLARLAPGAAATIAFVDPALALGRRLLDLGFVPGTPVRVLRRAPLGDPMAYEVRGTRLCLRRGEAEQIWVRAATAPDRR